MTDEFLDIAALRDEEEGLFARDVNGQLVRLAPTTAADFDKEITLTIDGQSVTVKKAVPATDSQGNPLKDSLGRAIPRATTIYDAARQLFAKQIGDKNPIPVLCHQDHVDPVAVCRVCVVEIAKMKRGKITRERKLLPACQHRVEDTMEVQTIESPDAAARERVRSAVKVLTELLVGDHLQGRSAREVLAEQPFNELAALAARLGVEKSRFTPPPADRGHDNSSALFAVDHTACILCDRCVRGCTDVRDNRIIGHTQKGYATRIAFDLDDPMGESGCVSCGECMISCPTGALTLRSGAVQADEGDDLEGVSVAQLKQIPLFSNISYKFLQWNSRSIVRRKIKDGEVLCREGESGSTAFVLLSGRYEVFLQTSLRHVGTKKSSGLRAFVGRIKTGLTSRTPVAVGGGKGLSVRNDGNMPIPLGGSASLGPPEDLILGEMTCLNHYPRSATVVAKEAGEVLEIGRNVLYMLQRDKVARELLGKAYRKRALASHLQDISLFKNLNQAQRAACIEFLRDRVELVHIDPGQVIFRQGDPADHFYMVRLGFVKVAQTYRGEQLVLDYLGPGSHFGEIGLLSQVSQRVAYKYPEGMASGIRTASCTALDDVELVRVRGEHFRELLEMHAELSDLIAKEAERLLEKDAVSRQRLGGKLGDFLEQGLFNAQKLLVLDLEACTRCDECTKACADSHEGVTRLVREGLRFDKFLVASSCRSCLDPYCLVGCPVDAIHRRPRDKDSPNALEIVIEDWCIGCSQCAKNCPYGNINMHAITDLQPDPEHPEQTRPVVQHKATTCDLCRDIVGPDGDVSCVYACPHNAAFRMSGETLFGLVNQHGP